MCLENVADFGVGGEVNGLLALCVLDGGIGMMCEQDRDDLGIAIPRGFMKGCVACLIVRDGSESIRVRLREVHGQSCVSGLHTCVWVRVHVFVQVLTRPEAKQQGKKRITTKAR